jgi:hypothetical protein
VDQQNRLVVMAVFSAGYQRVMLAFSTNIDGLLRNPGKSTGIRPIFIAKK